MTSLTKQVWTLIEQDVIAIRALEQGIVSIKSLAVHLLKTHKLQASADAVISAIRRYKQELPLERRFEQARKVLSQSQAIRITTHIAEITLEKSRQTQQLLQQAFTMVNYDKGEILLVIAGEQTIKLIINQTNMTKIREIFQKKAVLDTQEDIAEVNILLSDEAVKTPGILSVLCTELMVHDINIVETMSCVPEMLFFVREEDVVKTYELLFRMCTPQR